VENGSIDPTRRHLNLILRGGETATGVVEMAQAELRNAGASNTVVLDMSAICHPITDSPVPAIEQSIVIDVDAGKMDQAKVIPLELSVASASEHGVGDIDQQADGDGGDGDGDSRRVERDEDIVFVDWDSDRALRQPAKSSSGKLQAEDLVRTVVSSKGSDGSAEWDARLRWAG
jgi:hypothetical protein